MNSPVKEDGSFLLSEKELEDFRRKALDGLVGRSSN